MICSHLESVHEEMIQICNHVAELVEEYGATCVYVAWMGPCRNIRVALSSNIDYRAKAGILQTLFESFGSLFEQHTGIRARHPLLLPVRLISRQGCHPNNQVVKAGWNNKKTCISHRFNKLVRMTGIPIYISVSGKYKFSLMHPKSSEQMRKVHELLSPEAMSRTFRALAPYPGYKPREIVRRCIQEPKIRINYARNKRKLWDGEETWAPGSLEWNENELRNPRTAPVQPLCSANFGGNRSLSWACLDSRAYGRDRETLHHGMFVKVEGPEDRPEELVCTCDTFQNSTAYDTLGDCVHVQYVRKHHNVLRNGIFQSSEDVVKICMKDGTCVGYYYSNAFIRNHAGKGWRCDHHASYECHHVRKIQSIDQEDARSGWYERYQDFEVEQFRPVDVVDGLVQQYIHLYPDEVVLERPLQPLLQEAMERIHHAGLESWAHPKPQGRCFEHLFELKPSIPKHKCSCGLAYEDTEESFELEYNNAIVFLNPGRYDAKFERPVYRLECHNRKPECSVPYIGLQDGLWRASATILIELQMIHDAYYSAFLRGGQALENQCEEFNEKYRDKSTFDKEGHPVPDDSVLPFMDPKVFRNAAINFGKCLRWTTEELPNPMICPCCRDSPRVLIMDGTSMSIKSSACFAQSITEPTEKEKIVPRRWGRRQRCLVNVPEKKKKTRAQQVENDGLEVQRTAARRKLLCSCLVEFQKWIRSPSRAAENFPKYHQMHGLGSFWNLDGFLEWAHTNAKQWVHDKTRRLALSDFVRCIGSESPVISYVSESIMTDITRCRSTRAVPEDVMTRMSKDSPCVYALIDTVRGLRRHGELPQAWDGLLNELQERISDVTRFPEEYTIQQELGSTVEDDEANCISITDGSFVHSGILTGLPRIRQRPVYQADNIKDNGDVRSAGMECRHAFFKPGDRTGGLFTCLCEHGFVYASFIIKQAEGRNEPFTFMTCYLKKAPEVVIYDNACNLQDYCLSRAPMFFRETRFFVDSFHWLNHESCGVGYKIKDHIDPWLKSINTQAAEQNNAALKNYKSMMTRMSQKSFMTVLKTFMCYWNYRKLQSHLRSQERSRRRNA